MLIQLRWEYGAALARQEGLVGVGDVPKHWARASHGWL